MTLSGRSKPSMGIDGTGLLQIRPASAEPPLISIAALSRPPWSTPALVPGGQVLNWCDKGSIATRPLRPCCLSKVLPGSVFQGSQEAFSIGDTSYEHSLLYQGIIFGHPQVKLGTRPGMVPGDGHETVSYGIQLHTARGVTWCGKPGTTMRASRGIEP